MNIDSDPNSKLILQPIEPGITVPTSLPSGSLFLMNLARIVDPDIWDNLGSKEQMQSSQLRLLASHINKMADLLEELGLYLSSLPDPFDYENGDYEKSWEELNAEADTQLTDDYERLSTLVSELAESALGDFMD